MAVAGCALVVIGGHAADHESFPASRSQLIAPAQALTDTPASEFNQLVVDRRWLSAGSGLIAPTESPALMSARELRRVVGGEEMADRPRPERFQSIPTTSRPESETIAESELADDGASESKTVEGPGPNEAEPPAMEIQPSDEAANELASADQPAAAKSAEPSLAMPQSPSSKAEENRAPSDAASADRAFSVFERRPITSLTVNIGYKDGETPKNEGQEQLARMQAKGVGGGFARHWAMVCFQWEAPSLAYRPLYFEEVNLERYGYGMKYVRLAQPIISAGQFFTTVPILPYKMFAEPAGQPVYTLGQYRPGSDVPFRPVYPSLSPSGGIAEAGAAVGLIFLIP